MINAFAPALNVIIQLAIKAANAINQLLSALTGLSSWTRAKTLTDSYAKSLDKAGASAKELKKTVLGFDELNQLQDNKNSSSGTSPADMFEEVPIADKWKDWAAKIKDMWAKGDFTDLGKSIGEWLLNALNNIPWNKIKAKAYKLGKSLATLINGFVEVPTLGRTIGKSIAEALNTGIMFANGFVRNLHWDSIGKFIAETFNGFFENIDWYYLKDTVVTGMRGLAIAIQNFIDTFNWDNISKTIVNALDVISSGIKAFFENIDWKDLGSKVGGQISKVLRETDWHQIGEAIGDMIQAAIDFVSSTLDQLSWSDVINAITELFKGIFEKADWETIDGIIGFLLETAFLASVAKVGWGIFKRALSDALAEHIAASLGARAVTDAAGTALGETVTAAGASAEVQTAATGLGTVIGGLIRTGIVGAIAVGIGNEVIEGAQGLWSKAILKGMKDAGYSDADIEKTKADLDFLEQRYDGLTGKLQIFKDALHPEDLVLPSEVKQGYDDLGIAVEDCRVPVIHLEDEFKDLKIEVDNGKGALSGMQEAADKINLKPLNDSISQLDGNTTHAFDNMKSNSEVFSRSINQNTKTGFDAVKVNSKVLTVEIPQEVANAQLEMSGTVQELSKNFDTGMSDISTTVDSSMKEVNTSLDTVKSGMTEDKWTFSGVIDGLKNTFKDAIKGVAGLWNDFVGSINGEHSFMGKPFTVNLPKINGYATGGFIEDGLFTMNRGEIAGRFNNGKSVVANNEQITEGIARAVFNAMTSAQSSSGGQYINNTIMLDGDVLARAVTQGQDRLSRRYSPTMA